MDISCRQFALRVSNGELPLAGQRVPFWLHWVICPFCRRYWKEMRAIGRTHRANAALSRHPVIVMAQVKARLKDRLAGRFS